MLSKMDYVGSCSRSRQPRSPSRPEARPGKFPTKFRIRHPRSKTGCVTCRRRKKKCDEIHPKCDGCMRNGLDCSWPPGPGAEEPPPKPHCQGRRELVENEVDKRTGSDEQRTPLHVHRVSSIIIEGITSNSYLLFQHYLTDTAPMIFTSVLSPNPFITCVLPLAQTNPLLMHAMLAVSGSHLSYKLGESVDIQAATRRHYVQVLQGVQKLIVAGNRSLDVGIFLLVIAMLCEYEALSCSPSTTLFLHLNAARDLVHGNQNITSRRKSLMVEAASSEHTSEALRLACETFAYFTLSNTLLPFSEPSKCPCEQFTWPLAGQEASWSLFGAVFGGSYALFQLIPEIKALYCRRLAEEAQGLECPSQELNIAKAAMIRRIDVWSMTPLPKVASAKTTANFEAHLVDWEQKRRAAECLREALYIYAMLSSFGSSLPSAAIKTEVEIRIDNIVRLASYLEDSPYSTNLLWAIVMAGCCMENKLQRQSLVEGLKQSRYQMRHLKLVQRVLQLLWADRSPTAYGPVGLRYITEKHNMTLVIM